MNEGKQEPTSRQISLNIPYRITPSIYFEEFQKGYPRHYHIEDILYTWHPPYGRPFRLQNTLCMLENLYNTL